MNAAFHFRPSRPRVWLVAVVLVVTAGCGLKGPLYMPDSKPDMVEVKVPPGVPTPTTQKKDRETQGKPPSGNPSIPVVPVPPPGR